MTCHVRWETFAPKIAIFITILSITQAKRIINLLFLNNFYPVMSYRTSSKRKRKRRIIVYSLVTRYGPQTNCQRKWSEWRSYLFTQATSENVVSFGCMFQQIWDKNTNNVYMAWYTMPYLDKGIYNDDKLLARYFALETGTWLRQDCDNRKLILIVPNFSWL